MKRSQPLSVISKNHQILGRDVYLVQGFLNLKSQSPLRKTGQEKSAFDSEGLHLRQLTRMQTLRLNY